MRESRENNERQIAALEHTIDAKGTSKKEKEKAQNKLIQLKKLRDAMKNEAFLT